MIAELNIMSAAWQNFCSWTWGNNTRDLTVRSVNKQLQPYNAHCQDLGEWRVFFANEEALTFFLLKWS
jgi:hypothetical protein